MKIEAIIFGTLALAAFSVNEPLIEPESSSAIWFGEVEVTPLDNKEQVFEDCASVDCVSGFFGKPLREQPVCFSPLGDQVVLVDNPGTGPPSMDDYPKSPNPSRRNLLGDAH